MQPNNELWEIMVPTVTNEGKPIRTRFHQVWDRKVYSLSSGMTILRPAVGKWVSPFGKLFTERMIPVRIACNRNQIEEIIDFTMKYYDQLAIMAYKVSEEVILKHRGEK